MPSRRRAPPRIAIACQGGGSHAAFTAGALRGLLAPEQSGRFTLVGLSGTSGGAVCAALAWSGLLAGGAAEACRRLAAFWDELAASDPFDRMLNDWAVWAARLPVSAEVSPYAYAPVGEPRLRALLARHLDLDGLPAGRAGPALLIGAADVLSGTGGVFRGESLTVDHVVASAAVPPLFRAVRIGEGLWWDGLFSQNPPVRELLDLDAKPEEIWVIRLNPRRRAAEPITSAEIADRRNELAGNLPLDHELWAIRKFNALRREVPALAARYAHVELREIELDLPLDYPSKLDRSPTLLARLMERGEERARAMLAALRTA